MSRKQKKRSQKHRLLPKTHGSKVLTGAEINEENQYHKQLIYVHGESFGSHIDKNSGDPIIPPKIKKVKANE